MDSYNSVNDGFAEIYGNVPNRVIGDNQAHGEPDVESNAKAAGQACQHRQDAARYTAEQAGDDADERAEKCEH